MTKWKVHNKSTPGGRFYYYKNIPCIIVSDNLKTLVITQPLFELLGKPSCVLMMSDENGQIGLQASVEQNINAYKLRRNLKRRSSPDTVHYISATSFIREQNLRANTVCQNVHIENDTLVFSKMDFRPAKYKA